MELDAIGGIVAVREGHDLAFLRTRCHYELLPTRLIKLDNKRMVASDFKRGWQPPE
ncbi:hypothetical protein SAMN05216525_15916 [Bradyrhizobium sp. Gha]|nr:hypothetical protein SAMN05216525_15916 [Bradyrhizobium sp. Gha]